jgi:tripartite-type tricarboxylate transporter receptor subunit TctC
MKKWLWLCALLSAPLIGGMPALAADPFPSKPVQLLVPYPAGGAVDILARTLGQQLSERWGKPVVVENRPGAGGTIASQALVKSPPDGHTLIIVASGHAINPFLYPNLPYDTFRDFTPIIFIGSSPNILLVRADSSIKTLPELLALARQKPGTLSYGMAGNGTSQHLAGELLKYLAKVEITAVAYKGGAPALTDLIGGHIPLSINNAPEALAHIKAGTLRPLGVTTAKRSALLPEVPTIAEAGVPGFDTAVWWGLLAPAGLDPGIRAKLYKDCLAALNAPAVKERLQGLGATLAGGSPEEFAALIRADHDKWGPIIKATGIHAE